MILAISRGKFVQFDDEDADLILKHKWCFGPVRKDGKGYCQARIQGKSVMMHRFLLGLSDPSVMVDHINRDGLDNRRCNLRLATMAQNQANKILKLSRTGYRGVYKHNKRFRAELNKEKTRYFSPSHLTAESAARAYDEMAKRLHGEFAVLNFDEGQKP